MASSQSPYTSPTITSCYVLLRTSFLGSVFENDGKNAHLTILYFFIFCLEMARVVRVEKSALQYKKNCSLEEMREVR